VDGFQYSSQLVWHVFVEDAGALDEILGYGHKAVDVVAWIPGVRGWKPV
jgi:hypothetical protein